MYQMKKGGSAKSRKQQAAIAISMKAAGKKPKKMQMGGTKSLSPKTNTSSAARAELEKLKPTKGRGSKPFGDGPKPVGTFTPPKYDSTPQGYIQRLKDKYGDIEKSSKKEYYSKPKMQMGGTKGIGPNTNNIPSFKPEFAPPRRRDSGPKPVVPGNPPKIYNGNTKKYPDIINLPYRPGDYPKPKNPGDELQRGPYRPGNRSINPKDIIQPLKKAKMGGSLKPVNKSKNPGLAKLPTSVRNKMGYQKYGGSTKMKKGGMVGKSKKC